MRRACPRSSADQKRTLQAALTINLAMFAIESAAGWSTQSTGLVADSFDMLGDALTLALSLFVIGRGGASIAYVAMLKAAFMGAFGLLVLAQATYKLIHPALPDAGTMSAVGLLALAANGACAALLSRYRAQSLNMRSVWICSRNDVAASFAVLVASVGVWVSKSQWPDLCAGGAIAFLYLYSARQLFRQSAVVFRPLSQPR